MNEEFATDPDVPGDSADAAGVALEEDPQATTKQIEPAKPREKSKQDRRPKRQPPYHVILWNDDDHTYAYVIAMLQKLFGYPVERGYQLAKEVDSQGRAVVLTTTREHAELKRDQIHAFGKDDLIAACAGSMKASIEPAPGN
ncbi:MAG: ATP-dependent Clp protease adaptor ClpS [Pirellulales bacterium]|nr:ATP-dependent Clp protease adaptor ClpS [Pirellulales bacterium]